LLDECDGGSDRCVDDLSLLDDIVYMMPVQAAFVFVVFAMNLLCLGLKE
jgi:hypothetical protein